VHRGIKLLLALAAEGLKLHYKMDDAKVSEILGPVPRLPAPKRKMVLTALGFPVSVKGESVPYYACIPYVAGGLLLGKPPEELALMLGESRDKAEEMYREGLKWAARLAYAATRLAHYARFNNVRELGIRLIGDSIWTALAIYSASNSNMSVYGLIRNLSKELYQIPSEKDAEELKREMELLMNHVDKIMDGEPPMPIIAPIVQAQKSGKPTRNEKKEVMDVGLSDVRIALRELRRDLRLALEAAKELKAASQRGP